MNQGGLNVYVCQVDELWYLEIVPVLIMAQGNGKSGDTLVSQFVGERFSWEWHHLCLSGTQQTYGTAKLVIDC